jgi:SWI/SNF related-matrix-associated actin-dependent regulator of chromatin subfamily C
MDDDSVNFGSDAAGATPGSNSILAQPPLQGENASPSGQEGGQGEGQPECMCFYLL